MITAEHYTQRMKTPPVQDDLKRVNCPDAGKPCHWQCGWDPVFDLPIFLVGRGHNQREHFRKNLWKDYKP